MTDGVGGRSNVRIHSGIWRLNSSIRSSLDTSRSSCDIASSPGLVSASAPSGQSTQPGEVGRRLHQMFLSELPDRNARMALPPDLHPAVAADRRLYAACFPTRRPATVGELL